MNNVRQLSNVLMRICATFMASALSVIGAGALAGVSVAQAALMAGVGGVAAVVESLSRAFLADGQLSEEEINTAFGQVDTQKSTKK